MRTTEEKKNVRDDSVAEVTIDCNQEKTISTKQENSERSKVETQKVDKGASHTEKRPQTTTREGEEATERTAAKCRIMTIEAMLERWEHLSQKDPWYNRMYLAATSGTIRSVNLANLSESCGKTTQAKKGENASSSSDGFELVDETNIYPLMWKGKREEIRLAEADVMCLVVGKWLNDNVMDMYLLSIYEEQLQGKDTATVHVCTTIWHPEVLANQKVEAVKGDGSCVRRTKGHVQKGWKENLGTTSQMRRGGEEGQKTIDLRGSEGVKAANTEKRYESRDTVGQTQRSDVKVSKLEGVEAANTEKRNVSRDTAGQTQRSDPYDETDDGEGRNDGTCDKGQSYEEDASNEEEDSEKGYNNIEDNDGEDKEEEDISRSSSREERCSEDNTQNTSRKTQGGRSHGRRQDSNANKQFVLKEKAIEGRKYAIYEKNKNIRTQMASRYVVLLRLLSLHASCAKW
ncbi:hypothetical protein CBR_g70739 [Chara braunii]|uniref:Uncharacterized protein n=1 Tax=Chara braunii TaxID=69332 RepID=A0A388K9X2_CHABU|nr:hypothetical protein CBR_g70739 [Chara braunii]|eukprot:GBG66862.1 hypothetical protein CBR_g70739 [Chara braunii]